jgi:hypothetical protein
VIIPPGVDRGDSSYPLVTRLRTRKTTPQRWIMCFGFRLYETDVVIAPDEDPTAGGGGSHSIPQRLVMDPALRLKFKADAKDRDATEAQARRTARSNGRAKDDDDDDRWL